MRDGGGGFLKLFCSNWSRWLARGRCLDLYSVCSSCALCTRMGGMCWGGALAGAGHSPKPSQNQPHTRSSCSALLNTSHGFCNISKFISSNHIFFKVERCIHMKAQVGERGGGGLPTKNSLDKAIIFLFGLFHATAPLSNTGSNSNLNWTTCSEEIQIQKITFVIWKLGKAEQSKYEEQRS